MSPVRKAIDEYKMIDEGDRIAVGVSGGKDSSALLLALNGLKQFYPKKFEIEALTIDLGYKEMDFSSITELCQKEGIRHTVIKTQISQIIFDIRKEKNPCSLCAKMRKGALNEKAKEMGCNKIAYAHHRDDIVETMMMSLIFEGHFYCFPPKTYLDRTDLFVIRPLMFVKETDITGFTNKYNIPIVKNACPADGITKREYVKNLVNDLNRDFPGVRERFFSAIINGNMPKWPKRVNPRI